MNKWNALNKVKINHLEIGICPICGIRLTSECEHRTDESEVWYAAQILAEQELYVEKTVTVTNDETITLDLTAAQSGPRWIISRSWADKHLNSDNDLQYFEGGAIIK